jgi:hypothetical protein
MKKLFSILFFVALTVTLQAQVSKKNFQVSDFNGISAGGVFDIEVVKSTSESMTVEADPSIINYITAQVVRGKLKLGLDSSTPSKLTRNMKPIRVVVMAKELREINLSGAARLATNSSFSAQNFRVDLSGATTVTGLDLDVDDLTVVSSGASTISIKGNAMNASYSISGAGKITILHGSENLKVGGSGASAVEIKESARKIDLSFSGAVNTKLTGNGCDYLSVEMSGASNFDAINCPVKVMDISLSGVCNAEVYVLDSISVELSGGSNIRYKGSPQIKSLDISSISSFKKIN